MAAEAPHMKQINLEDMRIPNNKIKVFETWTNKDSSKFIFMQLQKYDWFKPFYNRSDVKTHYDNITVYAKEYFTPILRLSSMPDAFALSFMALEKNEDRLTLKENLKYEINHYIISVIDGGELKFDMYGGKGKPAGPTQYADDIKNTLKPYITRMEYVKSPLAVTYKLAKHLSENAKVVGHEHIKMYVDNFIYMCWFMHYYIVDRQYIKPDVNDAVYYVVPYEQGLRYEQDAQPINQSGGVYYKKKYIKYKTKYTHLKK